MEGGREREREGEREGRGGERERERERERESRVQRPQKNIFIAFSMLFPLGDLYTFLDKHYTNNASKPLVFYGKSLFLHHGNRCRCLRCTDC